jgi:hypothetical protein
MIDRSNTNNRDQVLLAFHQACEVPSARDVIAWTEKYPEFADDIREHAAILRDWAAEDDIPDRLPDESAMTAARSRALSALRSARSALTEEARPAEAAAFSAMIESKGVTIPALARAFDIDRTVIAALVSGRMHAPIGRRFVEAWESFFEVTRTTFDRALDLALAQPRLGHAKSGQPAIITRSYEDIVRSSTTMSADRKSYWLGEG